MNQFSSAREAKEFLVSRIVEEAQREGAPLSEVERKMLYFTETGWTLPNIMDISDEFDRDYDRIKYEAKIAHLIRNDTKRLRKENQVEFNRWLNAVRILRKEDHYILVMIDESGIATHSLYSNVNRKSLALGIILACVILAISVVGSHFGVTGPRARAEFGSYTIDERMTNFFGYACLCSILFALCGIVFSHFDHHRTLDRVLGRVGSALFSLIGVRTE